MIPLSTVLKIGFDEANTIWGQEKTPLDHFPYFNDLHDGLTIITNDSQGSLISDGSETIHMPGFQVKVIDPVGAGDAFLAGFIGELYRHTSIKEIFTVSHAKKSQILKKCLIVGNVCGALTCTQHGDTQAMPNITKIKQFIQMNRI